MTSDDLYLTHECLGYTHNTIDYGVAIVYPGIYLGKTSVIVLGVTDDVTGQVKVKTFIDIDGDLSCSSLSSL